MTDNPDPAAATNTNRPVYKLSRRLIDTYKHINEVYYTRKKQQQSEDKDFHVKVGDSIADRYRIEKILGKGSFGQVIEAQDGESGSKVAVKIIKSRRRFFEQAQIEINLLRELNSNDSTDKFHIVRLLDTFMFNQHQCLVFELLSWNLYDLLKQTDFYGLELNAIRHLGGQLLEALYFLRTRDIIHCDIKPENIVLLSTGKVKVKLIDFGSSCRSSEKLYEYIQSRFYRAPEVLLRLGYSPAIDVWSLACVLVEMHVGSPLFPGLNSLDQIGKIIEILGLPPDDHIQRYLDTEGKKDPAEAFFEETDGSDGKKFRFRARPKGRSTGIYAPRNLWDILGGANGGPQGRWIRKPRHAAPDYQEFMSFIMSMIVYDPRDRVTPLEALADPFMDDVGRYFLEREGLAIEPRMRAPMSTSTGSFSEASSLMEQSELASTQMASTPPNAGKETKYSSNLDRSLRQMKASSSTIEGQTQHHSTQMVISPREDGGRMSESAIPTTTAQSGSLPFGNSFGNMNSDVSGDVLSKSLPGRVLPSMRPQGEEPFIKGPASHAW